MTSFLSEDKSLVKFSWRSNQ